MLGQRYGNSYKSTELYIFAQSYHINMNQNTEFEQFTQRIYQKLVNNDYLKPIKVLRNVKLQGESGCKHQIDVYWEYENNGRTHRKAIECKNYNTAIQIGKVRDFFGVLYDLGNIQGIMVTTKGFQVGAKKYAKHYGISLKELRKPTIDESVGEITISNQANIKRCLFLVDEDWAIQHDLDFQKYREKLAFIANKSPEEYWGGRYVSFETKDDIIRNSHNEKISSLQELEKQLPDNHKPNDSFVFPFEDAWIESRYWGPIKIHEVKYEFIRENTENTFALAAEDFVDGILKDAISGEMDYIPKY